MNSKFILVGIRSFFVGGVSLIIFACTGGDSGDVATSPWVGEYESPHGVRLVLEDEGGDAIGGELFHERDGVETAFPVQLRVADSGLDGSFASGSDSFPLLITHGEEPGQIVVTSEGATYELVRRGTGTDNPLLSANASTPNPLTQAPDEPAASPDMPVAAPAAAEAPPDPAPASAVSTAPAKSAPAPVAAKAAAPPPQTKPVDGANFRHPDGYFSMKVPSNWEANMLADDVFELLTGEPGDLVILLLGDLEPHEIGKPVLELMPEAIAVVDEFFAQNTQVQVDSYDAQIRPVTVGPLKGATSTRAAYDGFESATVWQGVVTEDDRVLMLISSISEERMRRLAPELESAFASVRLHKSWSPGDLNQASAATDQKGGRNTSGRNVVINGQRIDDATLARLEGPSPVIPDGEYWYDNKSGMAGNINGPTEAYLAAGLNLGGALSPNASGGETRVAFNGRYLHPIDLAGLEYYFGEIMPGRYWIDGEGNYGTEGGPQEGNLVEEIAAIEMLASAMQTQMQYQYQQQLQQQVQAYQGQGGYYSQGGGYESGGSVYSHFPNLGASGTGVTVADAGGGDTIVNAGGVLWWPGK